MGGRMILTSLSAHESLSALTSPAIAQVLISRYGTLTEIAKAPIEELQTVPGVGPRKARQIQSTFELARFLAREVALDQPHIDTPERVAALFREDVRVYTVETFQMVLLNTRKRLIKIVQISQGTLDTILVDYRRIGSVSQFAGDFSMILGAVKVFDDFYGDFAAVLGLRPQRGASFGSKATPLLV
jgi:DNA repair protein RadC